MISYFENDYASYKVHEGILYVTYHRDVSIDLEAATQIVKDRLTLHEGRPLPILCDMRGVKEVNKAARAYLAIEGSILIKAVAFIVEPPVTEMLSLFYIRTSAPPIPTKPFKTLEEALVFLTPFTKES